MTLVRLKQFSLIYDLNRLGQQAAEAVDTSLVGFERMDGHPLTIYVHAKNSAMRYYCLIDWENQHG